MENLNNFVTIYNRNQLHAISETMEIPYSNYCISEVLHNFENNPDYLKKLRNINIAKVAEEELSKFDIRFLEDYKRINNATKMTETITLDRIYINNYTAGYYNELYIERKLSNYFISYLKNEYEYQLYLNPNPTTYNSMDEFFYTQMNLYPDSKYIVLTCPSINQQNPFRYYNYCEYIKCPIFIDGNIIVYDKNYFNCILQQFSNYEYLFKFFIHKNLFDNAFKVIKLRELDIPKPFIFH